jgi:4-alpha-glucanotransferase
MKSKKTSSLPSVNARKAGVLMHISSLPNPSFSTGDIGPEARRFIDILQRMSARVWQTLPINMTHADGSPYQCLSAHAGNPDFISMADLCEQGLLTPSELETGASKSTLIAKAFEAYLVQDPTHSSLSAFCAEHNDWLDDFCLFLALRNQFHAAGWQDWPSEFKNRDTKALRQAKMELAYEISLIQFTQYLFFSQWAALKAYAKNAGVELFGDIPIFVAYDSADVWAHPHLFKLDANKHMTVVAGVPPDYFSATGQRWGNPHYNWEAMAADGFHWWVARMQTQNQLFDIVRIDHFRGLEAAWEIPASEETAMEGAWVLAPGDALLKAIKTALPNIQLVAEDLGIITPEVDALRNAFHLPGMKILQFAFGGDDTNPYLPQNIDKNSVAYAGTHDNDTSLGWYLQLDEHTKNHLHQVLKEQLAIAMPNMPFDLTDLTMQTKAQLAIVQMQDVLGLDGAHRMNVPGTTERNWRWRMDWAQLSPQYVQQFANSIQRFGR